MGDDLRYKENSMLQLCTNLYYKFENLDEKVDFLGNFKWIEKVIENLNWKKNILEWIKLSKSLSIPIF